MEHLFSRRRIIMAGLVCVVIGALAVHPTWARSIGADVWNVPELEEDLRQSSDRAQQLADRHEEVRHRIWVKEAIITGLLAHRITFAEATEKFTVLNTARPEYLSSIRRAFPGGTDQEKMARSVIAFVKLRLASSNEKEAVLRRLELDLQRMMSGSTAH